MTLIKKIYFDWKYYRDNNKDLSKLNPDKLYKHWKKCGINESRKFRDNRITLKYDNFNWKFYIFKYKDLKKFKNMIDACEHWYKFGQYEKRLCEILKQHFDWKYYIKENNLKKKKINSWRTSWQHFISIINNFHRIKIYINYKDNRETNKNFNNYILNYMENNLKTKQEAINFWYVYGQYEIIDYTKTFLKDLLYLGNLDIAKYTKKYLKTNDIKNIILKNQKKIMYKLILNKKVNLKIISDNAYNLNLNNNNFEIKKDGIKIKNKILNNSKNILYIYKINNLHEIFLNKEKLLVVGKINDIILKNENLYKCSINLPISLTNSFIDNYINFIFNIKKYLKFKNCQINILNVDDLTILDNFVIKNDVNYIHVDLDYNKFKFNLGFTRNLYKFLNLSNLVFFTDIDIFTNETILNNMISKISKYDIICPYVDKIYNLNYNQKYDYINNKKINEKHISRKKAYTISGGNTLFKKHVLESTGGYLENNSYGGEDRFFDVILLYKKFKIFKFDYKFYHLWHPINRSNINHKKIENFNKKFFNCFGKIVDSNIHKNCKHCTKYIENIIKFNKKNNSNLNLFEKNKYMNNITLKNENLFTI